MESNAKIHETAKYVRLIREACESSARSDEEEAELFAQLQFSNHMMSHPKHPSNTKLSTRTIHLIRNTNGNCSGNWYKYEYQKCTTPFEILGLLKELSGKEVIKLTNFLMLANGSDSFQKCLKEHKLLYLKTRQTC